MRVVGVTGSFGTGKSTVAGMFARRGAVVVDADRIAHRLMFKNGECFEKVVRQFGRDILKNGSINRRKLAKRVFGNARNLRGLQRILHPCVRRVIQKKLKQYQNKKNAGIVVLDVPLLFETGLNRRVDLTIVVQAEGHVQLARSTKMFGITKAEAQWRIDAQMPLQQKIRLADFIIDNNGSLNQTRKQVEQIWEKL